MGWKDSIKYENWHYWFKGAFWGFGIYVLYMAVSIFLSLLAFGAQNSTLLAWFYSLFLLIRRSGLSGGFGNYELIILPFSLLIIGSFIGWIIGKIKSRKQ